MILSDAERDVLTVVSLQDSIPLRSLQQKLEERMTKAEVVEALDELKAKRTVVANGGRRKLIWITSIGRLALAENKGA